ncbi:hypothetical protein FQN60_003793 [Etheostoma spectabile]|uniref:Uncharacterized protein n=1 Tax=Etheostoma spectabile TaxID=54343 RepID=A0A5J5CVE3_9PERO|nr:hypothetical protein FQN60_003793 [Etheostoma spectabile]
MDAHTDAMLADEGNFVLHAVFNHLVQIFQEGDLLSLEELPAGIRMIRIWDSRPFNCRKSISSSRPTSSLVGSNTTKISCKPQRFVDVRSVPEDGDEILFFFFFFCKDNIN